MITSREKTVLTLVEQYYLLLKLNPLSSAWRVYAEDMAEVFNE